MISHQGNKSEPELERTVAIILILAMLCSALAYAQEKTSTSDADAMYEHIKKAQQIAGEDLTFDFYHRCFIDPNYGETIAQLRKANAPVEPLKVFDNLYFLGQHSASSWALQTSEGFVVFDTLWNPEDGKQYIEDGLVKLGLDPAKIKYIVITHEHGDHYGSAAYLKQKFGSHIVASAIAWDAMESQSQRPAAKKSSSVSRPNSRADPQCLDDSAPRVDVRATWSSETRSR